MHRPALYSRPESGRLFRSFHAASLMPLCLRTMAAAVMIIFVCSSVVMAQAVNPGYPSLPAGFSSIKVFDSQRRFTGRILPEKRYWVGIERIPLFLQKAVVAVEDARFYEHGGIDVRGIARALVKDVVKGRLAEGGSTITQQLIKNRHLSGVKTLERKLDEARLALEYEEKYTKKQILEMYFNEIYYGNGAWGVAQAARLYFDKNPDELNDAECAMLAGVQKNPARYNPLGKPEQITGRRDVVLKRMKELNMITARQQQELRSRPPTVMKPGQAPHYLGLVRSRLIEQYGAEIIEQGGLEITAALDLNLQIQAETILREGARKLAPDMQGSLIALDAVTGDVLAAVGGTESAAGGYNRAFTARRQPGSAIKPLLYAAALEKGITAASRWDDTPVAYDKGNGEQWMPRNYGLEQRGMLSLRQALAYSSNVIAVKVLDTIGIPSFQEFAGAAGLKLQAGNGLSLALGTDEVTLAELVQAYTPFATGGIRAESRIIIRVYDSRRRTWLENPPVTTPVMTPAAAFITTQMLRDVMTYGTARRLEKFAASHPSAGKTGTTSDYRDAWFIGYTPGIVTGVWIGHDKPRQEGKGFTGGGAAAPIWERFMRMAVAARPSAEFTQPETVTILPVDPATGCRTDGVSPARRNEFFAAGTEPDELCNQANDSRLPAVVPEMAGEGENGSRRE